MPGTWETLTETLPVAGEKFWTTSYGGYIWIGCGWTEDASSGTHMWRYDPATGAITLMTPAPRQHAFGTAARIGNLWYFASGYVTGLRNVRYFDVYDLDTDTWTQLPDIPFGAGDGVAVAIAGKVVVIGGYHSPTTTTSEFHGRTQIYDPGTATWTQGAEKPDGVGDPAAVVRGNDAYVIAGYDWDADVAEVWAYNLLLNTWRRTPGAPYAVDGHGWAEVDQRGATFVYLIGGWAMGIPPNDPDVDDYTGHTAAFVVESPANGPGWYHDGPLPVTVWAPGAAAHDGLVYAFGGWDGTNSVDLNTIWRIVPDPEPGAFPASSLTAPQYPAPTVTAPAGGSTIHTTSSGPVTFEWADPPYPDGTSATRVRQWQWRLRNVDTDEVYGHGEDLVVGTFTDRFVEFQAHYDHWDLNAPALPDVSGTMRFEIRANTFDNEGYTWSEWAYAEYTFVAEEVLEGSDSPTMWDVYPTGERDTGRKALLGVTLRPDGNAVPFYVGGNADRGDDAPAHLAEAVVPAGTEVGDLLLLLVQDSGKEVTTPVGVGWQLAIHADVATSVMAPTPTVDGTFPTDVWEPMSTLWWKFAGPSDLGDTVALVDNRASIQVDVGIVAYRGVNPTDPILDARWDYSLGGGAHPTALFPHLGSVDGGVYVAIHADWSGGTTYSGIDGAYWPDGTPFTHRLSLNGFSEPSFAFYDNTVQLGVGLPCFDDQARADGADLLLRFRDAAFRTITDESGDSRDGEWGRDSTSSNGSSFGASLGTRSNNGGFWGQRSTNGPQFNNDPDYHNSFGTPDSSWTVGTGGVSVGNVWLVALATESGVSVNIGSGWTVLLDQTFGSGRRIIVAHKIRTGTETGLDATWTFSSPTVFFAITQGYTAASVGTITAYHNIVTGPAVVMPSFTPALYNSQMLLLSIAERSVVGSPGGHAIGASGYGLNFLFTTSHFDDHLLSWSVQQFPGKSASEHTPVNPDSSTASLAKLGVVIVIGPAAAAPESAVWNIGAATHANRRVVGLLKTSLAQQAPSGFNDYARYSYPDPAGLTIDEPEWTIHHAFVYEKVWWALVSTVMPASGVRTMTIRSDDWMYQSQYTARSIIGTTAFFDSWLVALTASGQELPSSAVQAVATRTQFFIDEDVAGAPALGAWTADPAAALYGSTSGIRLFPDEAGTVWATGADPGHVVGGWQYEDPEPPVTIAVPGSGICDDCGVATHASWSADADSVAEGALGLTAYPSAVTLEMVVRARPEDLATGFVGFDVGFANVFAAWDNAYVDGGLALDGGTDFGDGLEPFGAGVVWPTGCWNHVVMTWEHATGQLRGFLNGQMLWNEATTGALTEAWAGPPGAWTWHVIGRSGDVAAAVYYPVALSRAQIAQHFAYMCSTCGGLNTWAVDDTLGKAHFRNLVPVTLKVPPRQRTTHAHGPWAG